MSTALSTSIYMPHSVAMETGIGAKIRAERDRLGLTQTALAAQAGVDRAYLSQIELGKVALPNAATRRALAQSLGIKPIELLVAAGELTSEEAQAGYQAPPAQDVNNTADEICRLVRRVNWHGERELLIRPQLNAMIRADQERVE